MKRFSFLLGVGVGFVLGSRAGSQPYERLASTLSKTANRSDTHDDGNQVKGDATHPTIDPVNVAGAGEEAADRGITGLEV